MLIVQVCDFGNDGDSHYRLHEPSRQLGKLPGLTVVDCHLHHRFLPELSLLADVLIVQFVNDWDLLGLCERRRAAGKVTVFEANDYFFDLQPWNPLASSWQERSIPALYEHFLRRADAVQTSTAELARHWQERGARVVAVFPNDLTEVEPLPPPPTRPLTIGWAGSPGHFGDWYQVAPLLQSWLQAHPEVHLGVMTHEFARPFIQLPPERYHFTPFGSLADYLHFLRSLDIGLAPLLPTDYNRCRSDVKFLEYASQGVVGIYADLAPYRASVVPGETGLIYRNSGELLQCLDRLYADAALRQKIREQAHAYVRQHRLQRDHIQERLRWYQSLLPGSGTSSPLSAEILKGAVLEGGYVQLRPQEPEQTLLYALQKPTPGDAVPRLARVVEQHPRYLMALQSLGQILNDQRDHRRALAYLERAHALDPQRGRTWSEIGRTWFRLNDEARARAALEEAVRVNPPFYPAWQYALRFFGLSKSPEGPRWAERAEELFPTCYSLALLGAQTYPTTEHSRALLRILEKFGPTLTADEKVFAVGQFRQAILAAVQATPASADTLALLRRACEIFPHSARLASELGVLLYRLGRTEESYRYHARALELQRQSAFFREEFPQEDGIRHHWQFAEHIREVLGAEGGQTQRSGI